jgi:hypothetical protein
MFRFIEGMPPDVLAIEAVGEVTHEDYRTILIPKAEAMMVKGPIKMIYVIGKEFSGYNLEALWDDGAFGIKHWRDFRRIAVVADQAWMRAAISMFAPFFSAELRLFNLSELSAAKEWIIDEQHVAA